MSAWAAEISAASFFSSQSLSIHLFSVVARLKITQEYLDVRHRQHAILHNGMFIGFLLFMKDINGKKICI